MLRYYVYYVSALASILAVTIHGAEALSIVKTLPVDHSPRDAQALWYGYHWISNHELFTHKAGIYKRIWDVEHNAEPLRVTEQTPYWDQCLTIARGITGKSNRELERKVAPKKRERCDEQTYALLNKKNYDENDSNGTDGWEVLLKQSNRDRLFLRPDGKQYSITELEKETEDYDLETITIYETATQQPIKTFKSRACDDDFDAPIVESLKFDWSPDSEKFAIVDTYHLWDTEPETITVYNTDNFSVNQSFEVTSGPIRHISVSPNSAFLAAYTNNYAQRKQAIHIWNIVRGHLVATLMDEHYGKRNVLGLHEYGTLNKIWSPDSSKIATYTTEGNINIRKLPQP